MLRKVNLIIVDHPKIKHLTCSFSFPLLWGMYAGPTLSPAPPVSACIFGGGGGGMKC